MVPRDEIDLVPLIQHVGDTLKPLAGDLGVTIRLEMPGRSRSRSRAIAMNSSRFSRT